MALPLWMQIVAKNRTRFSPAGAPPRTFRVEYNATPIEARGARRKGSSRTKKEYSEGPEGVIERLEDQGFSPTQIDKIVNDDRGGGFDALSPGDWVGAVGDLGGKALDVLDVPRRAVAAGLIEATDVIGAGLDKIPGVNYEPFEGTDRLRQTGISWEDVVQNFNNGVGGADVLQNVDNPVAKAVGGFALDVAMDPLNYLLVGAVDEPKRLAQLFRDPAVIRALGKDAADEAGAKVLQKGVNALSKEELAAVGRQGGLGLKVPGTGPIGRLTRLDKALAKVAGGDLPRAAFVAPKGTKVGDLAAGAAAGARQLGFNQALKGVGGLAAKKGLAGSLGRIGAAVRGADDILKPLDASLVKSTESRARHVGAAFKATKLNEYKSLLARANDAGVDSKDLFHAIGNASNSVSRRFPQLVADFQRFLEDARVQANTIAGREFMTQQANYVPRVWTDAAREKFGIPQAKGKGGTKSITRKRNYVAGTKHTFGKGKNKKVMELFDPTDPQAAGRSVEQQIEDFLVANNMTSWFKDDALDVIPDYVNKLSRQLSDEYLGNELKTLGVAEDMWIPELDKPFKSTKSTSYWAPKNRIERDVKRAEDIVRAFGASSVQAKSLNWQDLYNKAKQAGVDWTPEVHPSLNDLLNQTGQKWAQFGTGAALPADVVGVLRDIGKMAQPDAFPTVMRIHDRLLNGWKKLALLSPGYHWRNTFSGVYMNWLADMDEGRYAQMERLIANDPDSAPFFRGRKTVTKPARRINDPMLQSGYGEMKRLGIFGGGQSIQEIDAAESGRIPSLFRGSRKVGGAIENRLRGALFLDEYVKTGGDSAAAFDKVQKYHFDYSDLGDAERSIRRGGVPFYTYLRRSIPTMLEMVVRNPSKVNRYFRLKDSVERLSAEENIVPGYFERNFATRLPWFTGESEIYALPDLPFTSLVETSDPDAALGQISPFIKTPLELKFGKQIWKGIPLEDKPVEPPGAVRFLMPALRVMGRVRTDSEGNEVISENDLYALQQFLPQIGQYRRLFPTEDKYEERRMTSVLSFLFGLGLRTNTPREQAGELWNRVDSAGDAIEEQEQLGYDRDTARAIALGG